MRWGLVLGILAGLLWTGDARAGVYTVHACSLPDGAPAPIEGWNYEWNLAPGSGWNIACTSDRVQERAMSAWVEGVPVGTYSRFTFAAPRDTLIAGYTLYRYEHATAANGGIGMVLYSDGPNGSPLGGCGALSGPCAFGSPDPSRRLSPDNRTQRSSLAIQQLTISALCTAYAGPPTSCEPGIGAWISIYAAQVQIQDAWNPVITEQPSGPLLGPTVDGVQTLKLTAEDRGGGLATAVVLLDGRAVASATPDAPAAKCVTPFVAPVPCPLKTSFHVDFDTRLVANGAHDLQVEVSDAAGNVTRTSPTPVTVQNDGIPNGAPATRLASVSGRIVGASRSAPLRRLLRFGEKATLTGRLTDSAGHAIAGASLVVEAQVDRPGAAWGHVGSVVTAADGTWAAQVGSGASRRVRVSYRAFAADAAPSAELVASLRVRARVSLSVTPRRTSRAGKIVFKGRLVGGPGRARTQVALYAVPGRGRRSIPVTVLSAGPDGKFRYSYRFSGSFSNVTYRFQARVHSQPGYPYAEGGSKLVSVRVR